MIFPYDKESEQCLWMKDMLFSVDIIWVGADKQVTSIKPNLSPDTYPDSFCAQAQYVIELPAGEASKSNLRIGQKLNF